MVIDVIDEVIDDVIEGVIDKVLDFIDNISPQYIAFAHSPYTRNPICIVNQHRIRFGVPCVAVH